MGSHCAKASALFSSAFSSRFLRWHNILVIIIEFPRQRVDTCEEEDEQEKEEEKEEKEEEDVS